MKASGKESEGSIKNTDRSTDFRCHSLHLFSFRAFPFFCANETGSSYPPKWLWISYYKRGLERELWKRRIFEARSCSQENQGRMETLRFVEEGECGTAGGWKVEGIVLSSSRISWISPLIWTLLDQSYNLVTWPDRFGVSSLRPVCVQFWCYWNRDSWQRSGDKHFTEPQSHWYGTYKSHLLEPWL